MTHYRRWNGEWRLEPECGNMGCSWRSHERFLWAFRPIHVAANGEYMFFNGYHPQGRGFYMCSDCFMEYKLNQLNAMGSI